MAAPAAQRITPKKLARFLEALAECGNVRQAASRSTLSRDALYHYRKTHEDFAQAWKDAIAASMELVLEPEAQRRAVSGVREPVYYQGKRVGAVQKYSDTLLIFLLKGGLKDKYSERTELTGAGGGPMQIEAMPADARRARIAELMARRLVVPAPCSDTGESGAQGNGVKN